MSKNNFLRYIIYLLTQNCTSRTTIINEKYIDCGRFTDGEALVGLPLSSNATFVAQDVMCNGTEFSVAQCPFNPPTPACYVGNHGAGVICRESK